MEVPNENAKSKSSVWQETKDGIFNVFVEMLKNRKVSRLAGAIHLSITFMQIYGTVLMDSEYINWSDDIAADSVYSVFRLFRVIPAIEQDASASFFWFVLCAGTSGWYLTV